MTESSLTADWVYNTTSGSFWLPQPPDNPVSGFWSRVEGSTFETDYYKGRSGFMHNDKIDITMSKGTNFNAGDFYAVWIAPMIAGRSPNLPKGRYDRCSLAVVGSILQWGLRYAWGIGFIDSQQGLDKHTEHVFAMRGTSSYKKIMSNANSGAQKTVAPVYGDPGAATNVLVLSATQSNQEQRSVFDSPLCTEICAHSQVHLGGMEWHLTSDQYSRPHFKSWMSSSSASLSCRAAFTE